MDKARSLKQNKKVFGKQSLLKIYAMNAQTLRQQLTNLSGSTGGHKEQADRYRALLDQILTSTDPNQSEFLKLFIEASK